MNQFIYIEKNFDAGLKFFDDLEAIDKKLVTITERAITIIASRAKQIITEKGHVITGNLRRSVKGIVWAIMNDIIYSKVGSHVHYAYYVERLPDGGYLFQAFEEKFKEVVEYMAREIRSIL